MQPIILSAGTKVVNLNGILRVAMPKAMLTAYAERILATESADLLAYWPLWEASGSVADNLEGTAARDGAYTGVTLGEPGIGDGATCPWWDGANDYLDVYSVSLSDNFDGNEGTIFWWMKVTDADTWGDGQVRKLFLLSCGASTNDDFVLCQKSSASGVLQFLYGPGVSYKIITADGITDTGWIPCAMTFTHEGSDLYKAYMYGEALAPTHSSLNNWTMSLVDGRCEIGAGANPPYQVWDGWLAHFAIWNKALSDAQIVALSTV